MPRFFTSDVDDAQGRITGDDALHIQRVLRMRAGEEITVCDLNGYDYKSVITSVSASQVCFRVKNKLKSCSEPSVSVTLYMSLPKGDKLELIVQKSVELGIERIVPVLSARCVSRPDAKSAAKKIERYNKIAYEAAKQCGRAKIPIVEDITDFKTAVKSAGQSELSLLFYEKGGSPVNDIVYEKPKSVAFFIGSEGGFDESEAKLAEECSVKIASLGPRILRCETAAIAALSIIMHQTGNM